MRFGIVTYYAYRPHVEHMAFLAKQLTTAGHEVFYLTCDASFTVCNKNISSRSNLRRKINCLVCQNLGLRSYDFGHVETLKYAPVGMPDKNAQSAIERAVKSSLISELRINFHFERVINHPKYNALLSASYHQFERMSQQLLELKIDKLVVFNGRVDFTAAAIAAAKAVQIPFYTVERSWLGYGLNVTHNGVPLDLAGYREVLSECKNKQLSENQQNLATNTLTRRFTKNSLGEFKQFNLQNNDRPAIKGSLSYCPSSIFERALHPDWEPYFYDEYEILDQIRMHLNLKPEDVIIRAHPQWRIYGKDLENFHQTQAVKHGFNFISSDDQTDTSLLIDASSCVIVNGSSTAFEAGFKGKIVLNISPTFYDVGEFCQNIIDYSTVPNIRLDIDKNYIQELTLRAWYNLNFKRMSFTDYVIPRSGYDYLYSDIPPEKINTIFVNDSAYLNKITDFDVYNSFDKDASLFAMKRKALFFHWEILDRWTR